MVFDPESGDASKEKAYFAAGCFWGVEYHFEKRKGVSSAVSGYMGGTIDNPDYDRVCSGKTGHLETVEVTYDPHKVTFRELAKLFFEIHNPEQKGGQGPDIGPQYESAVFYTDENQKKTVMELMEILKDKGIDPATKLLPAETFWKAEEYHQDYYERKNGTPYCHVYTERF